MWHIRPVRMGMNMGMAVRMGMIVRWNHRTVLYYNITGVHDPTIQGLWIAIAIAAATNGNGMETAARNHTNRAGMNGISQSSNR